MVKGLGGKMYEEEWRILGLFSLEETVGWLLCRLQLPHDGKRRGRCWSVRSGVWWWDVGNTLKLHQGNFILNIRKKLFTDRVVKHWKKLPREVVMASRLTVFKKHLDKALRYVVKLLSFLVWNRQSLWVSSNSGYSIILWILEIGVG